MKLDLFVMIKERFAPLSVFMIIIFASVLLLVITWKRKETLPRILSLAVMTITILLIAASIYGMIFLLSFGYNA